MPKSCTVHRSISLVRSSNEATWRRVLTFQVPILNSSRSWLSFPVVFPSALWWASSQDKGRDRVGCRLLSPPGPEENGIAQFNKFSFWPVSLSCSLWFFCRLHEIWDYLKGKPGYKGWNLKFVALHMLQLFWFSFCLMISLFIKWASNIFWRSGCAPKPIRFLVNMYVKGVLHPRSVFGLFLHFSQKLQHIGNK